MLMTRKAAVMYGIDDIRIENLPIPDIGPDDVLVRIRSVGVCGSDIHFYKEGRIGSVVVVPPHILGHECAGEIVGIGANVKNLKIGDKVAIEPGRPCGKCELCLKGKYNLCPEMIFMSAPHPRKLDEGAFVEYSARPAHFCFPLPEHISFDEGAMVEPLAVALQALKQGKISAGQSIAILGCGPIGLAVLIAAKAYGCSPIYMTDIMDYRLNKAKTTGATEVFNVAEEDYTEKINKLTGGRGVDAVIDTTGSEKAYMGAVAIAARGSTIVLVGMSANEMALFNIGSIIDKELFIAGVFRYNNVYQQAVNLISSGIADVKQLISHRLKFENIVEAMDIVAKKRDNVVKVIIDI